MTTAKIATKVTTGSPITSAEQDTSTAPSTVQPYEDFHVVTEKSKENINNEYSSLSSKNISINNLYCQDDRMIVKLNVKHLAKNFFISLLDTNCQYHVSILDIVQNEIELSIQYHSCGTILINTDSHVVFTNRLYFRTAEDELSTDKESLNAKHYVSATCKQKYVTNGLATRLVTGYLPINTSTFFYVIKRIIIKKFIFKIIYQLTREHKTSGGNSTITKWNFT